ncbi:hypothetical protein V6N11_048601 [Hibiscus sabdariffa]|uniref:Uncharacterized protein n=1 Tax=Hibiscus sabdariffa TaxID=183260 RepID=A0ABR2PVY5_9ROSI
MTYFIALKAFKMNSSIGSIGTLPYPYQTTNRARLLRTTQFRSRSAQMMQIRLAGADHWCSAPRAFVPSGARAAMFFALSSILRYRKSWSIERSLLIGEGSKRPCVADNTVNARKRKPRIAPDVYVEPEDLQLKELPHLDNFVESAFAAGTGVGAEEEDPADLDLSLYL